MKSGKRLNSKFILPVYTQHVLMDRRFANPPNDEIYTKPHTHVQTPHGWQMQ